MSNREIAEVVQSRQDNVRRAICRLMDRGAIGVTPLEEFLDDLGRPAYPAGPPESTANLPFGCGGQNGRMSSEETPIRSWKMTPLSRRSPVGRGTSGSKEEPD